MIFQNGFSPKAVQPEAPGVREKSKDQSGGPRTNLEVFGDVVSFQYFQKTWKSTSPRPCKTKPLQSSRESLRMVQWGPHGSPWKIQECRKSWILMEINIRFDRNDEARGPVRCAMSLRSILSRRNALNSHMEQNIYLFCRKSSFSVFRPRDPL